MNLLKNTILIFLLFISISCDNSTEPEEENNKAENYIHLQNQTDHSGVLITLIENNVVTITDSLGLFIFPKVDDGEYILQAKYPFFEIIEKILW